MSKLRAVRPEIRYILYFAVLWAALIGVVAHFFDRLESQRSNSNQKLVSHTRGGATEIQLKANRQGHYLVNGTINNHNVTFILDTGATTVSVSEAVAQKAGLNRGRPGIAQTAAGTVKVWSTIIPELRMGNMRFNHVPGTISPAMDPEMVLLGMSVLRQLNFSQQSGVLTLSIEAR
ncbi:retropepsin-like aspartic protease family protein [Marinobacter sp.]|uniref:retropepsin-like aspartic protease family protein n=1 Tax=Marinobacter sp. TaxID=50741 RepID=UPI003B51C3EA